MIISGVIVDVLRRKQYKGRIYVDNGMIQDIQPAEVVNPVYILPGLIDSHVHIESSMVAPVRFAQNAVKYGVVATVSDPHEIANVCGEDGINYMLDNAKRSPFKFFFGAPSCVPSTSFEHSGAIIDADKIAELFDKYKLKFLAEMMNYPGVVNQSQDVMAKLNEAIKRDLPIDGHAPGLTGEPLIRYIKSGVDTDHECSTLLEGEEKISLGMKILIREGSAAKNFEELYPLIDLYPDHVMLCSDDSHPENISSHYLNRFMQLGQERGIDFWNLLQALTINPVMHYKLDVGLLQPGDPADFIVVNNLKKFNILQTWIAGKLLFDGEKTFDCQESSDLLNIFNAEPIISEQIAVEAVGTQIKVIQAFDKQLFTDHIECDAKIENGLCIADPENDILKLVVVNRYDKSRDPSVAFIKGFGLKEGAIASSVAHDSHNIIAVGTNDDDIVQAINYIIENKGGLAVVKETEYNMLPLPIAGLMSDLPLETIAIKYAELNSEVKNLGSELSSPFMTLSFMSLLVIPKLKLSDKGLFDVSKFDFTNLFVTK